MQGDLCRGNRRRMETAAGDIAASTSRFAVILERKSEYLRLQRTTKRESSLPPRPQALALGGRAEGWERVRLHAFLRAPSSSSFPGSGRRRKQRPGQVTPLTPPRKDHSPVTEKGRDCNPGARSEWISRLTREVRFGHRARPSACLKKKERRPPETGLIRSTRHRRLEWTRSQLERSPPAPLRDAGSPEREPHVTVPSPYEPSILRRIFPGPLG